MDLFDLTGKKAIVTGGSRGLGMAMAEGLMEAGAGVVIIGRTSTNVQAAVDKFKGMGYDCQSVLADVGNRKERNEGFDKAVELLGGDLDILVNAAAITHRCQAVDYTEEMWDDIIAINQTAPFELSARAARLFLSKNKGGKIINIASIMAFCGSSVASAYSATKGAIVQMTKSMSNELAGKGICVNAIAPGFMLTDMNAAISSPDHERYTDILNRTPRGRWGVADDMKGATVFLASDASDFVTGSVLTVDGGYLAK